MPSPVRYTGMAIAGFFDDYQQANLEIGPQGPRLCPAIVLSAQSLGLSASRRRGCRRSSGTLGRAGHRHPDYAAAPSVSLLPKNFPLFLLSRAGRVRLVRRPGTGVQGVGVRGMCSANASHRGNAYKTFRRNLNTENQ